MTEPEHDNGKWGIIDAKGNMIVEPNFDDICCPADVEVLS